MKKVLVLLVLIPILCLYGNDLDQAYPVVDWTKAGADLSNIIVVSIVCVNNDNELISALNDRNKNEVTRIILNPGDYNLGSTTPNLDRRLSLLWRSGNCAYWGA